MITFTRHVFATLTYQRNCEISEVWRTISLDYNRFHQRLRRLHRLQIEYLRVIEEHRDGYPHIHALLQYPSACIRITNSRYFDSPLYRRWKDEWRKGHSDYQKPRKDRTGTLAYVMKYCLKNQTKRTVWKKVLKSVQTSTQDVTSVPTTPPSAEQQNDSSPLVILPTHKHGVKICSWSRGFDFTPFTKSS